MRTAETNVPLEMTHILKAVNKACLLCGRCCRNTPLGTTATILSDILPECVNICAHKKNVIRFHRFKVDWPSLMVTANGCYILIAVTIFHGLAHFHCIFEYSFDVTVN